MNKIIIGLGNPGVKYKLSRHNLGFMLLDYAASILDLREWADKKNCQWTQTTLHNQTIGFLKPMTFMNCSGEVAGPILKYAKLDLSHVLVIHDDLELDFGQIRFKVGGSARGHNGVRNLMQHCGANFHRLRMGVGHPGAPERVHDYVLQNFSPAEVKMLPDCLIHGLQSLEQWIQGTPCQ